MSKATVRVVEVNGNARAVTFVQISAHTYSAECKNGQTIYVRRSVGSKGKQGWVAYIAGIRTKCWALKPASAFAAAVRKFWK